ncbi:MAG: polyphosphate kinase 2 family protein [Geminicoccaceae bacterium]
MTVTRIDRPGEDLSLPALDVSDEVSKKNGLVKLAALQEQLRTIQIAYRQHDLRAIIVFEGWDAAGKGGTIRRMTSVLDPRHCKVWPIGAPSPQDQGKHYLYRFWQKLPEPGSLAIFDRSWYGRVLVERIEQFADGPEVERAFGEIIEFENLLVDDGVRLVKVFLHIDKDEQARRFERRLKDPLKRWKLTWEDIRNRERWAEYEHATENMLRRTATSKAPWHVVASNDKAYTRIAAIDAICEHLADGVDLDLPAPDKKLAKAMWDCLAAG